MAYLLEHCDSFIQIMSSKALTRLIFSSCYEAYVNVDSLPNPLAFRYVYRLDGEIESLYP
jgi:hypothetical protein